MWLNYTFWYLLILLKYILVGGISSIIIGIFFPIAGWVVAGLFLIGMFPAATKDFKENRLPKIRKNNIKKEYAKINIEFKGFEESLRSFKREWN
ncbi:hypothetical protein [Neobacillus sp. YIM B06451]|uniref:hypothetical protein n=1 Tax=Neobacillus sp. YIM B06451 TaxID=3070994 RepID=UPI0029304B1A|nr:hypothetical protein [Neobacillus sp. YIM B06451]